MHGNTTSTDEGFKTRHFSHILSEIRQAFEIHAAAANPLGGVHLELTGEDVTECTGGAQGFIDKAQTRGVDAYLSGEISEPTTHFARETGMHYFACGHHATERYGVQALGQWLNEQFGVEHIFIDIDNPA